MTKVEASLALEQIKRKCLELLNILVDLCEKHKITYWLDGGTLLGAARHKGMIPWDDDIDICFPESDHARILEILREYSREHNPYIVYFHGSRYHYGHDYFADTTTIVDGAFPARVDLVCVKYVENTPEAIRIDNSWANIASMFYFGYPKHPERVIAEHQQYVPKGKNILLENEQFYLAYHDYMRNSMELPSQDTDLLMYYCTNDFLVKRDRPHFDYNILFPLQQIEFEGRKFNAPKDIHMYLVHLYGENYMQFPPKEQQKSHMNFLAVSNISKEKWSRFVVEFHKSGLKNLAIGKKNKQVWRPLMKTATFLTLIFKLGMRGDFGLMKGLIWYSKSKVFKKN